jgi:hypothetical protein
VALVAEEEEEDDEEDGGVEKGLETLPSAKAGTIGRATTSAIENVANVNSLIADLVMRVSRFDMAMPRFQCRQVEPRFG